MCLYCVRRTFDSAWRTIIQVILVLLPVSILILSVIFHEVAHAWSANKLGDPTAKEAGRLTLNPIPHIDLFGSIIIPGALIIINLASGGIGFIIGWAKPVPVNPQNFKRYQRDDTLVSLAGPASNFILVFFIAILSAIIMGSASENTMMNLSQAFSTGDLTNVLQVGAIGYFVIIAFYGIYINVLLALFNLLPVPPLDGSHVVTHLLPQSLKEPYMRLGAYGIFIILGLILLPRYLFNANPFFDLVRTLANPFLSFAGLQ
jgi:Zn-dependent protease